MAEKYEKSNHQWKQASEPLVVTYGDRRKKGNGENLLRGSSHSIIQNQLRVLNGRGYWRWLGGIQEETNGKEKANNRGKKQYLTAARPLDSHIALPRTFNHIAKG